MDNTVSGDAVIMGPLVQAGHIGSIALPPAPPPWTPRQVPVPHGGFVNRDLELTILKGVLATPPERCAQVLVTGVGGVGKTQLVAHWAGHPEVHARYPGGQLYVDLEDLRHDGAVDISGVLGILLRSLKVHESYIPPSLAERSALFRSATAGRPTLVVLDNVRHAAEVGPLLPAAGLAVVLSRTRLAPLLLDGAVDVPVAPLDSGAGVRLVRRWRSTGTEREAAELVALCGGLPLLLRAVGERLVERPHTTLEDVVRDLSAPEGSDGPEGPDGVAGPGGVVGPGGGRAVMDTVVADFSGATRRFYDLLGLLPGTTFTAPLAHAAGAEGFDAALTDLLAAHLAVPAGPRGRYRLHDVVRAHARALSGGREGAEERRREALRGVVAFYVDAAARADRLILGKRWRLQEGPEPSVAGRDPLFTTSAEALDWLDDERDTLLAVLRYAAGERWYDAVWRLCESMWALFEGRKHYADWIESHRLGIEAAAREGRFDAEVRMRNQLARAHYGLGEYDEARDQLARAEALLEALADPRLSGAVRESQGLLYLAAGQPDTAVELFRGALEANAGDRHGIVVQSYNLGQALLAAGRDQEAADTLTRAAATADATGDDGMRSKIGIHLARAQRALGDPALALRTIDEAAVWAGRRGQYTKLDQALELTAELAGETGDDRLAEERLRTLRELRARMGLSQPPGPA
ncbi:tetratricopeptide repeat protein [Streptomyces sp. JV176]|uniref:tetratricopeptide repeat protein n=1 Tax=Streptomyces sp. JV176 TaxID=858630 RepID=UPI002E7628A9|nr:tetratricopeptide repeat protein [Streptomyces sp. JV176]MEE1800293.1 tetratricopeptide repeat protein [Streptomyces sp. JV176]